MPTEPAAALDVSVNGEMRPADTRSTTRHQEGESSDKRCHEVPRAGSLGPVRSMLTAHKRMCFSAVEERRRSHAHLQRMAGPLSAYRISSESSQHQQCSGRSGGSSIRNHEPRMAREAERASAGRARHQAAGSCENTWSSRKIVYLGVKRPSIVTMFDRVYHRSTRALVPPSPTDP